MRTPEFILRAWRLTKREYFADFFITPPITLFLAWYSLNHSWGWLWLPEFSTGFVAWTLYEYALHRWALHGMPVLKDLHALHHRKQSDYIASPPWLTVTLYALFWLAFGVRSSAFMIGFYAGYVVYAAMHTAFHYARFSTTRWYRNQYQRHMRHHRFGSFCYGISTGLWDRVFGTEL